MCTSGARARAFCSGALAAAAAARTSRESPFSEHFICKTHYMRTENARLGRTTPPYVVWKIANMKRGRGRARNAYSRSGVGQLYVCVRVYV